MSEPETYTYTPRPGTVAYRLLAVLEKHGGEMNNAQLAEACDVDPHAVANHLTACLNHGLVSRRQRDTVHVRSPYWWRFGPQPSAAPPAPPPAYPVGGPSSLKCRRGGFARGLRLPGYFF